MECESLMVDKSMYVCRKIYGKKMSHEEHVSLQEQKWNNMLMKRRTLSDQSDKKETIGGQYR